MASIAMPSEPSVLFLKPTGQDRPEASSRWPWLSVVRAPIAPQLTRSVRDVLRADEVQELGAGRQAELVHLQQKPTGELEAGVDLEGAVEVRVVDQPLPADGGPRFLEIDPHHDVQVGRELVAHRLEPRGVVLRRHDVVHRAGADDDEQAVVRVVEDVVDLAAGLADREGGVQLLRRQDLGDVADAQVVGEVLHGVV